MLNTMPFADAASKNNSGKTIEETVVGFLCTQGISLLNALGIVATVADKTESESRIWAMDSADKNAYLPLSVLAYRAMEEACKRDPNLKYNLDTRPPLPNYII